jgi:SAM-dependent methyltransferase
MVTQGRRRNRAAIAAQRIRLLQGESGALPLHGEAFDAVLAVHTIYFWPDLTAGLQELQSLLVPGGRIVIGFRPAERGRPRRLDPAVYRIPTTSQLIESLVEAGFVDSTAHDAGPASIVVARTPAPMEPPQRSAQRSAQ